jgi:hypothetical protein
MTLDERHLTTALRTYARAVEVTDADLELLESRVRERIHPSSPRGPRNRPWQWAVAACAVTALVLAVTALWRAEVRGTAPASPASITPADLAGAWLAVDEDGGGWIWYFTANGGVHQSNRVADQLDSSAFDPTSEPDFTLEPGNIVSFVDYVGPGDSISSEPLPCRAMAGLAPEGRMTLTPISGQNLCGLLDDGRARHYVRVSPISVAGAALVQAPGRHGAGPAFEPEYMVDLAGTWLLKGTGTVLYVNRTGLREGEYVLDDDGDAGTDPDEVGTVALRPNGGAVFHPTDGTGGACYRVYQRVLTTTTTFEAELDDASCGVLGGSNGTWVRLN